MIGLHGNRVCRQSSGQEEVVNMESDFASGKIRSQPSVEMHLFKSYGSINRVRTVSIENPRISRHADLVHDDERQRGHSGISISRFRTCIFQDIPVRGSVIETVCKEARPVHTCLVDVDITQNGGQVIDRQCHGMGRSQGIGRFGSSGMAKYSVAAH